MRRGYAISLIFLLVFLIVSPPAQAQEDANAVSPVAPVEAPAAADAPTVGVAEKTAVSAETPAEETTAAGTSSPAAKMSSADVVYALVTLGVGIAVVLGLIIFLRVNAFIALISAAMLVSLMAPGDFAVKMSRVASAFGSSAGGIGIVIALAAVIGKCMLDSGAADRIVRAFLRLLGEKHAPIALMGSGFVLAVPVFFDTVFYLLVPLARSLHKKTGKQYLKYILAIAAGGAITHTLVPPTPGPLLMAENLGVDVGLMIMVGALVALPAAIVGLLFAGFADRIMKTPMRSLGGEPDPEPIPDDQLPGLWLSLAPVLLPVGLISISTVLTTLADSQHAARLQVVDISDWSAFQRQVAEQDSAGKGPGKLILANSAFSEASRAALRSGGELDSATKEQIVHDLNELLRDKKFYQEEAFLGVALQKVAKQKLGANLVRMKQVDVERMNRSLLESAYPGVVSGYEWSTPRRKMADASAVFGNANFALLLSTVIAIWTLARQRGYTRMEIAQVVEGALMSGGVIILITAGGGAFGAMLNDAKVGDAVQALFEGQEGAKSGMAFLLLGFLVAAVLKVAQGSSTVAMIVGSAMVAAIVAGQDLGFNKVYLATAIGGGSLIGSWMNDSGFWIFSKMGGLTEGESLKSWSIMLLFLGFVSLGMSVLLANIMPLI